MHFQRIFKLSVKANFAANARASLSIPHTSNAFKHYGSRYSKSSTLPTKAEGTEVQPDRPYARLLKNEQDSSLLPKTFTEPIAALNNLNTRVQSVLKVPQIFTIKFKRTSSKFVCEVELTWPERRNFNGEGRKKILAKGEASHNALEWLLSQNFITQDAKPNLTDIALCRNIHQVNLKEDTLKKLDEILTIHQETISPILSSYAENLTHPNDVLTRDKLHPILGKPFSNCDDLENWNEVLKSKGQSSMKDRSALPIDNFRNEILQYLKNSRVTIIKGETGCGKTTRVPQFILDDAIREGKGAHCNIVVVQPRRLTTMETAKYVASERGERIGSSVGYSVRMSSKLPSVIGGSITFMTGMKLAVKFSSESLPGVSHIVLDEVHLRDGGTDLVMTLLKQAMKINEKLKIVIMSATMDTTVFQSYFNCFGKVPIVEVPGRTFPVKMHFLEHLPPKVVDFPVEKSEDDHNGINFSLVQRVVSWINQKKPAGAILVFVAGLSDISTLQKSLSTEEDLLIVPVHSIYRDCSAAFEPAPSHQRKVILATNVAETSITFPDVVYVVDCGIHKKPYRKKLSHGGWTLSRMSLEWITKANVVQRRGRAGRVQPGESFHLFSKSVFNEMEDYDQPGVMTDSLEYLILSIKMAHPNIKAVDLLKEFPTPPNEADVRQAVQTLQGASLLCKHDETPTHLASAAMSLSCSLPSAIALIYSAIYRCFDQTLSVVASEETPLVLNKPAVDERALKSSYHQSSDHLAKAMLISDASMPWISHPSYNKSRAVKAFLDKQVKSRDYLRNFNLDEYSCQEIVLALLMKCFGSLLAVTHSQSLHIYLRDKSGMTSFIKSRSVNYKLQRVQSPFFMYLSGNILGGTLSITDTSVVSPMSVLLFLPSALLQDKSSESETKVFKVCQKTNVRISIPERDYQRIESLRKALKDTQDYFVKVEFLNQPDDNYNLMAEFRQKVLSCLNEILQCR